MLILYTDGVIEARRGREFFGPEGLLPLVAATEHDPRSITSAVVEAVLDFQFGYARDDIAVLTLGRAGNRSASG